MRNALFLLSAWAAIIIAAYAMVYWDQGIEPPLPIPVLEPAGTTYVDPNDRFSLVVPSAWDVEEVGTLVLLTDPSGKIEVTIFSVEQEVPEAALLLALGIVGSDETSGAIAVAEIPPVGATERGVKIIGPANGEEASYGLAFLYEGETIVLLVRGDEQALGNRAEDLQQIEAGIAVPAAAGEETIPVEEAAPIVEL